MFLYSSIQSLLFAIAKIANFFICITHKDKIRKEKKLELVVPINQSSFQLLNAHMLISRIFIIYLA